MKFTAYKSQIPLITERAAATQTVCFNSLEDIAPICKKGEGEEKKRKIDK